MIAITANDIGTTPTEESARRAVAIQRAISKELGLSFCENPWQGSFIVSTPEEKAQPIANVAAFVGAASAVKTHSLGQNSHALYDVGGEYRRNM